LPRDRTIRGHTSYRRIPGSATRRMTASSSTYKAQTSCKWGFLRLLTAHEFRLSTCCDYLRPYVSVTIVYRLIRFHRITHCRLCLLKDISDWNVYSICVYMGKELRCINKLQTYICGVPHSFCLSNACWLGACSPTGPSRGLRAYEPITGHGDCGASGAQSPRSSGKQRRKQVIVVARCINLINGLLMS
jgi:hypothetical protein